MSYKKLSLSLSLSIKQFIKKYLDKFKYLFLPINKNKIVFCNFMGNNYGCNPKYITEEIIKQNLPYDLVWLVRENNLETKNKYPKSVRLVEYDSKDAIKELFTAKIWVDNTRRNSLYQKGLFKRKNQKYIQTWHGSLGIKKVEACIADSLNPNYVKYAKVDSTYIDYMLSNSLYDDKMFGNDFWYNGDIIRTGHPRLDIFFSKDEDVISIKNKVKKELGIDKDKNFILYVPTFRDDYSLDAYDIDINNVLEAVKNKFKGEWCFAIRLHPNLSIQSQDYFKYDENIKNATFYSDVLELLLSADICITDYSSCIFDYIFTKRPAFIYASDLEKYNNDRGFYYPLENAPFPLATTNKQLIENIANFDSKEYLSNVEKFLKKHECMEDGHSSQRAVELIKTIIEYK